MLHFLWLYLQRSEEREEGWSELALAQSFGDGTSFRTMKNLLS